MSEEGTRFMWLMVFFDLPVKKKSERRSAAQFRRFLIKDGYCMIQFSVYARICNGSEGVDKHLERVKKNLPKRGHIRSMQVTDRQYERIQILIGEKSVIEKKKDANQLLLF